MFRSLSIKLADRIVRATTMGSACDCSLLYGGCMYVPPNCVITTIHAVDFCFVFTSKTNPYPPVRLHNKHVNMYRMCKRMYDVIAPSHCKTQYLTALCKPKYTYDTHPDK